MEYHRERSPWKYCSRTAVANWASLHADIWVDKGTDELARGASYFLPEGCYQNHLPRAVL